MPGRTPSEAFHAFVDPLATALGCIARCKITPSPGGMSDPKGQHQLLVNNGERLKLGGRPLTLGVRMRYEFIQKEDLPDGPWKIKTLAYSYSIEDTSGSKVISYHWHPGGTSHAARPHLHLGDAQLSEDAVLTSKQHVPTSRVALEQVISGLIGELGIEPLCDDWDKRLALTQGVFELYRSWA